jgi:hypothetical protein
MLTSFEKSVLINLDTHFLTCMQHECEIQTLHKNDKYPQLHIGSGQIYAHQMVQAYRSIEN